MDDIGARKGRKMGLGAAHVRSRDAYKDVPILKRPTWNNDISAYFFLGGISAGAAILGSLAQLFGGKRAEKLARTAHYVSFVTILPCPPLLIDDLGYPARFHHMLRIFKPSSPMSVGSWALTTHGMGTALMAARMLAAEGKLPLIGGLVMLLPERVLAGLGIPSAFTLGGYTGVLLGTSSIPVWYTSPLLGALFMASAFSTGTAATSLVRTINGHQHEGEHRTLATLSLAMGGVEAALLAGYIATTGEAAEALEAPTVKPFMLGARAALLTAAAAEILSMTSGKAHKLSMVGSVATLVAGALLRWGIVRSGKPSAEDREGTVAAMKSTPERQGWVKSTSAN